MNSLTFLAPSGAPCEGITISQVTPSPTPTSGASYVGFFGIGGPEGVPFAVIVGQYQDTTYITNSSGLNLGADPYGLFASGQLHNHKYLTASTANVANSGSVSIADVPQGSGTILVRFNSTEPEAVRTQNAVLRTVALNSAAAVDDIGAVITDLIVQSYETGADNSWTQTGGTGALDNRLFFTDHNTADDVHDFFASLSASPESAGERNNFGFLMVVEFL